MTKILHYKRQLILNENKNEKKNKKNKICKINLLQSCHNFVVHNSSNFLELQKLSKQIKSFFRI